MNRNMALVLGGLMMVQAAVAGAPIIQKTSATGIDNKLFKGFFINDDQVFKITAGALQNKVILFTSVDRADGDARRLPEFVVLDGNRMIDRQAVPTLEEGWNIVEVDAVGAIVPASADGSLRILAILTLEPLSGRPQDDWKQPFVFDISNGGKIQKNVKLNQDLSTRRTRLATIKSLKLYLAQHAE